MPIGDMKYDRDLMRSCIYGLAVGDALGVPYEFHERGTFTCEGMDGYGTHHQPAGTWSDDTSMALAMLDSIAECGCVDTVDMAQRFNDWLYGGAYTCDGYAFDVGGTTSMALRLGHGMDGECDCGNGSVMRAAPLAALGVTPDEIERISAITHAHAVPKAMCVGLVDDVRDAAKYGVDSLREPYAYIQERLIDDVDSGGYCVDTAEAAMWCLLHTDKYSDCVKAAVNLGGDTDTTAAVAGALAGAAYGVDGIPARWLGQLRGKAVIEGVLRKFV